MWLLRVVISCLKEKLRENLQIWILIVTNVAVRNDKKIEVSPIDAYIKKPADDCSCSLSETKPIYFGIGLFTIVCSMRQAGLVKLTSSLAYEPASILNITSSSRQVIWLIGSRSQCLRFVFFYKLNLSEGYKFVPSMYQIGHFAMTSD